MKKTLLAIAFAAISATAFAQPAVLRAVAPEPTKSMEQFPGNAIVEVWIDSRGLVVDSTVLKPLPGHAVIEAAARQWMFEPEAGAGCRFAVLNFRIVRREAQEPTHWEPWSQPDQYSVVMTWVRDTVWRLPRDNGAVAVKRCPLHHEVMSVAIEPLLDDSPPGPWNDAPYWRAHDRAFPTIRHPTWRLCVAPLETEIEVYVCAHCVAAEAEWLRRHPYVHR